MAKKDKEEKVVIEKNNKREEINLKEFMLLDSKKQDVKIKETLDLMYEGKIDVTKKHIDKVLNIAFDTRDNETYLPGSLRVEKIGSKLIFSFKKTNNLALFILFALAFLFIGGFATYMGVEYLARLELNQDLDGDGVCDINCDTDKDNVCDTNCTNVNINGNGGGTSQEGNGGMDFTSADLIVIFDSTDDVVAENIYPDDQAGEGFNTTIPSIGFTIQNTTNQTLYYNLSWTVNENTFTSDNFWYRVTSDNAGFNQDWTTAPTSDYTFATRVAVAPNTTQTYSVDFTLHGTGEPQNYDQGKVFSGQIHVDLIEE